MAVAVLRQKVDFENAAGARLAAALDLPRAGARAFACFAHCFTCSKDIAAASRISRALAEKGYGVLRFDFTGIGSSEGEFANTDFSSNVEDLVCAADFLRRAYQAPQLLVGHSLGGAAVLVAAQRIAEVRAVATIGAPSDTAHLKQALGLDLDRLAQSDQVDVELGGRSFTITAQFVRDLEGKHLERGLQTLRKATLIMHSPVDEVVAVDHARRLFEMLKHPKSFVSLDNADHLLSRVDDSRYVADVLAAWASRFVPEPPPTAAAEALAAGLVRVGEVGEKYTQQIAVRTHRLIADEPESLGGKDRGPTPYELLQAALGACTAVTLRMYADRKGWPLQQIDVEVYKERIHAADCVDCEQTEGMIEVLRKRIDLVGDALDAEQRTRLLQIADRCPVNRTLKAGIRIETIKADDERGA